MHAQVMAALTFALIQYILSVGMLTVESNSSYVLSDGVKFFRLFSMGARR